MSERRRAVRLPALAVACLLGAACGAGTVSPGRPASPGSPASAPAPAANPARSPAGHAFVLPSLNGLNYGGPTGADGQWLGSRWLQPGAGGGWALARPGFQADLDFIVSHRLGRVIRLFIGLDQLMVWDRSAGFVRFSDGALDDVNQMLDMLDAHHLVAVVVVFDQEEVSSPQNFRFQALDGKHAAMRANYLEAVDEFFRRFGGRATVAGWDLFNEAYNSLGREGGLPRPPAPDPVSPNFPDETVHAWIRDLYQTAKRAAPNAWLTVSDTTDLYWKDPPDTGKYADAVDFYDLHVYDDNPTPKDWAHSLHKPYLLGEVGGDFDHGLKDQSVNSRAVAFWLAHARQLGVSAVLAHAADSEVYSLSSGTLTPTGRAVQAAS